jgi:methylamine dehydrogenase heavy chain
MYPRCLPPFFWGSGLMTMRTFSVLAAALPLAAAASPLSAQPQSFAKPLAEETVGVVQQLPARYPHSYVFVSDLHFSSLLDGRAALVDVADPAHALKGQIRLAQFGNFLVSRKTGEIYTSETFFSRLTQGERTDVLTVWDPQTLAPKGEIILPGNKRGHFVTQPNALQFTNDEKWLLVYNFTPAASVTVIDVNGRKILGDVNIPGCALSYPTGLRGFSTLCGDGSWTTVELDEAGGVKATHASKPMINIDDDPWFMIPAMAGRTAWFVSYRGRIRGFDLSGARPRDLGGFSMVARPEAPEGPRPGGWQVTAADAAGAVYVLMSPKGREGTHKDGGSEVWVADTSGRQVARRIPLRNPALSIEVTQGTVPLLVAAQPNGNLDVYEAASGKYLHTIFQAVHDPFTMAAASK